MVGDREALVKFAENCLVTHLLHPTGDYRTDRELELRHLSVACHGCCANRTAARRDDARFETTTALSARRETRVPTFDELLAQAKAHHRAGQLREAAQIYRQLLETDSAHVETLCLLGSACDALGKPQEAANWLRQAVRLQGDNAETRNYLGAVLAEQGLLDEAIVHFQQACRLRPDSVPVANNLRDARAARHNQQGLSLAAAGKHDHAAACYRQALAEHPDYGPALINLGNVLKELGQVDEAVACYRRVLELAPDSAEAHHNLGLVAKDRGSYDEAAAHYRRALALKPDSAQAHYGLALVLVLQNKLAEAEACYRSALTLAPTDANAHFGLACVLLAEGRFAEGWPQYEWRPKREGLETTPFDQPRWTGSPLAGRTILLRCEQGFGDALQFIRYADLLKRQGGRVIVECRPQLSRLLATCAGVDEVVIRGQALPPFDVYAPLASVPGIVGTSQQNIPADVPYLAPDARLVARWRQELDQERGLRVGIAWQGNPGHDGDCYRSFPLARLAGIAAMRGVRLYSLQMGAGVEQLSALAGTWPIIDLGDRLGDFYNTAAIFSNLDLVITCDSAPAHLAGALGVRVWLALAYSCDWRWMLERTDSPWYPTMRLFRQSSPSDWDGVFREIEAALAAVIGSN
jgi:tetratricopeptide (TPR) repeat protein